MPSLTLPSIVPQDVQSQKRDLEEFLGQLRAKEEALERQAAAALAARGEAEAAAAAATQAALQAEQRQGELGMQNRVLQDQVKSMRQECTERWVRMGVGWRRTALDEATTIWQGDAGCVWVCLGEAGEDVDAAAALAAPGDEAGSCQGAWDARVVRAPSEAVQKRTLFRTWERERLPVGCSISGAVSRAMMRVALLRDGAVRCPLHACAWRCVARRQVSEQAALSKVSGLEAGVGALERQGEELRGRVAQLEGALETQLGVNRQLMGRKEEVEWQLVTALARVRRMERGRRNRREEVE